MSESKDKSKGEGKNLQAIDSQCLAYEESCRQARLENIGDFLANVSKDDLPHLRMELAKIFVFYLCQQGSVTAGSSINRLREHLPEFDEPSEILELLRTEFQCRIDSDGSANLEEYGLVYPRMTNQINSTLATELLDRHPIRIRLISEDFTTFSTRLSGRLIAGRQDRDESAPPQVVAIDEFQSRLIVAARVDTKVARKHAAISPYAANRVKITALSERSATIINGERLAFQGQLISQVPVELHLGPQLMRLEPTA